MLAFLNPFSGAKARNVRHPGAARWIIAHLFGSRTSGEFDYHRQVGTGVDASVVMAPIQWMQRALPEAPLVVERARGDEWEPQPDEPLAKLLENPNPFYSGNQLLQATLFSYATDGNAYWIIEHNGAGRPVALWYTPHWLMAPKWPDDGSAFLSGYQYKPGGGAEPQYLRVEDVVHFRHGINPDNPRKGISPIGPALKSISADMESDEFVSALLRNSGVPGMILSPDTDEAISEEDMQAWKDYIMENFRGSHRGEPMVATAKTKVDKFSFTPHEMNLSAVTDRAEERVCALLGIPSAVVGFASGLESSKVGATMEEFRRLAWTNGILPVQRSFVEELERSLLTQFPRNGRLRVRFDTSEVAALSEDRNKLVERVDRAIRGGWMTVASGKRMVGQEPEPGDEVYLRTISVFPVPVGSGSRAPPREDDSGTRSIEIEGGQFTEKQLRQLMADLSRGAKHSHDPFEERIADDALRSRPSAAQSRFIRAQEEQGPRLIEAMEADLRAFFVDELGERAAESARPILDDEMKQTAQDELIVDRVLAAMSMETITPIFDQVYERHYLRAAEVTAEHLEIMGLATDIPDPVARAVVATGGRRAGLVDLTAQVKQSMFNVLETARAEGEGIDAIVRRLRDDIPAGPWTSADIRARVIARTETKHAQRTSVLEMGKANEVQQFMVLDARLGPTDAICEALDGTIVSADEAQELARLEHPNGTRDFVPHFSDPNE